MEAEVLGNGEMDDADDVEDETIGVGIRSLEVEV